MATARNILAKVVSTLQARGIGLARLQALHPTIDRGVKAARRRLYTEQFFRRGPRKRGTGGKTFVLFNHCYDLDVDALCAADTPHELWVLDPFSLFTDAQHFFPPGQRDLDSVYGGPDMRDSIARIKAAFITGLAQRLVDEIRISALITPADTFYYLRPLIEELAARGAPTIVQDKEGTIAPSAIMDDHARVLAERYPPIGDAYFFWNQTVRDFWQRVGLAPDRMRVLGQPRSDFFFHRDRWPTKTSLGLTEGKQLLVVFTYDSDVYLRVTEPLPDRPWKPMRDLLHAEVRRLARERPDLEIVVKAHPQQAELAEVIDELTTDPLPNVCVMTGAKSASHLIVHADAIVGFQSTVMIEAMLTDKPVIYAGWGAVHARHAPSLIPIDRSGGVSVPRDEADLATALRRALSGELVPPPAELRARRAFTDRYFFHADGNVSARVLDAAAEVATRGSSSRCQT
ncbi:MAG TPA: CDP-glycerol glycerophosphotransferase family protein [Kofleriaceae bacterium]